MNSFPFCILKRFSCNLDILFDRPGEGADNRIGDRLEISTTELKSPGLEMGKPAQLCQRQDFQGLARLQFFQLYSAGIPEPVLRPESSIEL